MKNSVLHIIKAKGKNKRVEIALLGVGNQSKAFVVKTKTLVDFKTRNILETQNIYSVETFAVLRDLFDIFLNNPEIKNKLILKELSEINKFKCDSTFKF